MRTCRGQLADVLFLVQDEAAYGYVEFPAHVAIIKARCPRMHQLIEDALLEYSDTLGRTAQLSQESSPEDDSPNPMSPNQPTPSSSSAPSPAAPNVVPAITGKEAVASESAIQPHPYTSSHKSLSLPSLLAPSPMKATISQPASSVPPAVLAIGSSPSPPSPNFPSSLETDSESSPMSAKSPVDKDEPKQEQTRAHSPSPPVLRHSADPLSHYETGSLNPSQPVTTSISTPPTGIMEIPTIANPSGPTVRSRASSSGGRKQRRHSQQRERGEERNEDRGESNDEYTSVGKRGRRKSGTSSRRKSSARHSPSKSRHPRTPSPRALEKGKGKDKDRGKERGTGDERGQEEKDTDRGKGNEKVNKDRETEKDTEREKDRERESAKGKERYAQKEEETQRQRSDSARGKGDREKAGKKDKERKRSGGSGISLISHNAFTFHSPTSRRRKVSLSYGRGGAYAVPLSPSSSFSRNSSGSSPSTAALLSPGCRRRGGLRSMGHMPPPTLATSSGAPSLPSLTSYYSGGDGEEMPLLRVLIPHAMSSTCFRQVKKKKQY